MRIFKDFSPRAWVAAGLGVLALTLMVGLLGRGGAGRLLAPQPEPEPEPSVIVTTGTVRSGHTLSAILSEQGLSASLIAEIQRSLSGIFNLRRMRPGDTYEIVTSTDGLFQDLTYRRDIIQSYAVSRSSEGVYTAWEQTRDTLWREHRVSGVVRENLYKDLLTQGYDERFVANLVWDLADRIFAWRIDFFTEQRAGDTFDILLEQEFIAGEEPPISTGNSRVLLARYQGSGTRRRENIAIRYTPPGTSRADYFDLEGKGVRSAFLRAPFTHGNFRISSHFNPRRRHPITRTYRPHHGTDYAAPIGTPVAAVGRGTVVRAAWHGGYGLCVDIRHSPKYMSRYGHLSRIRVKQGQTVEQGQWIANSGNTGVSTGPHLHFEMHVDGVQRNFLAMNFPAAGAVAQKDLPNFYAVRDTLLARLDAAQGDRTTRLAANLPES